MCQEYVAWKVHADDDTKCTKGCEEFKRISKAFATRKFGRAAKGGGDHAVWKQAPRRRLESFVSMMQLCQMVSLSTSVNIAHPFHGPISILHNEV